METVKLCFGFSIIVLFYIKESASFEYVPPSRELEVIQGGRYIIGVEKSVEFYMAQCHFISNTGLTCSFAVQPSRRGSRYCTSNEGGTENIVVHYGEELLCQISVSAVQEKGPTNWTLTVTYYDELILINNFKVNFFYAAPVANPEINVLNGSSLTNHLILNDTLKSCIVKYNDNEVALDLYSPQAGVPLLAPLSHNEENLYQITSLGRGLCGFKLTNVTTTLNTITEEMWTFIAIDNRGKSYQAKFSTYIISRPVEKDTHIRREIFMGSSYMVPCGSNTPSNYLCSLFNPAGELVQTKDCKYTIASFAMNDVGVWKCHTVRRNTMEGFEYTIELVGIENGLRTWLNETDDYYVDLGCQLNLGRSIQYCKMVTPNQQIINLQSSYATDRYLSLGTDLKKGVCSMQIRKPLEEFEKGIWQCEIGVQYGNATGTGSFINVGDTKVPDYPKHSKLTTQLDDPFTILCTVPYSSVYCRIRAPDGTEYLPNSEFEPHLGRCSFTVNSANHFDNGTWICSFARKMGIPDEQIIVEVSVAQRLKHDKQVVGRMGNSTKLMCSSSGIPLQYCRFVNPHGKSYNIHNHENSTSISYYGRGLKYGECGIEILNTSFADYGYWTCATKIINDTKHGEVSAKIDVIVVSLMEDGICNIASATVREVKEFVDEGLQIKCMQKRKYVLNSRRLKGAATVLQDDGNVGAYLQVVCSSVQGLIRQTLAMDEEIGEQNEEYLLAHLPGDIPPEFHLNGNIQVDEDEVEEILSDEEAEVGQSQAEATPGNMAVCMICLTSPPATVLLPCRHFGLCDECCATRQRVNNVPPEAEDVAYDSVIDHSICPMDRIPVQEYVKVVNT